MASGFPKKQIKSHFLLAHCCSVAISNKFDKKIFKAIYTLYPNGAKIIRPIDIEGIFSQDPGNKVLFEQSNGIEYLQDLQELAEVNNFHFYYNLLKKINLLNDLKKNGFDISSFYIEDLFMLAYA